jgi:AraC-like DNA-binding protein
MTSHSPDEEKLLTGLMDYTESAWKNKKFNVGSPNNFIIDYCLSYALKILDKNAGNVSEIAFETGFSSVSYFSKCFRKKYGCHPSSLLNH